MKKRKLVLGGVLVLLVALIAWGTVAYFTTKANVTNVITTGTVKITLNEKTTDGADFPKDGIAGMMPGRTVDKIVTVTNGGTGDAWIRAAVTVRIVGANGDELSNTVNGEPVVQFGGKNDGWTEETDGYYYYKVQLAANGTTTDLLHTVTMNSAAGNNYQGCKIYVDIVAQAVQVKNNPIPDGGSVTDVKGWPVA